MTTWLFFGFFIFVLIYADAEDSNQCNPNCNGVQLMSIPVDMRKLLPRGYSSYITARMGSNSLGGVSPRRAELQSQTTTALEGQALIMQRLDARRMGRLSTIGDIVKVKIPDVDRSKLDPLCLTAVVVEVNNDNVNVPIMEMMCLVILLITRFTN
jgi:hypothetical protein